MLVSLDGLEPETRVLAEEELRRRYVLPRVERVRDVKEEFGLTTWEVETDKGEFTFNVRHLREAILELSPTRLLITDMDGNRFDFPDIRRLDEKSYSLLQRML